MRTRLVTALTPAAPRIAALIEDPFTTLTVIPLPWLSAWTVVDAQNITPPHGQRYLLALSDDDAAEVLTGKPDAFNYVVKGSATVSSDETATSIATSFVDLTRAFDVWSYRVESVDDIEWLPKLNASEVAERDKIVADNRAKIAPPAARQAANGWTVTVWTVTGLNLIRHDLTIAADGTVTDARTEVVAGMPVPPSG